MRKPLLTIDTRMIGSSGIGTYIQSILSRLIKLRPEYDYCLIGNRDKLVTIRDNATAEIDVVECSANIYSVTEQIMLPRLIPTDTDLFWSPHFNIPIFYPGKLVVTVHDCFHLAMPHYLNSLAARMYSKALFGYVKSTALKVITDSQFTRSELVKLANIESSRIELVFCGAPVKPNGEGETKQTQEKPYILYVGNVKPHKNISLLLKAFREILEQVSHELLIVGKKDRFLTGDPELQTLAENISDRIQFRGLVSDQELTQLYQNASCLVMPSKYEGFGLPPIEAMTYGCPVISSTAASLPEICGDAALYFDPDDHQLLSKQILLVVNNKSIRDDLLSKGFENIKRFSWDQSAEKIAKLFDRIIT